MKYLVVGLGNPGEKYENTRHNIGFKVLDMLATEGAEHFALDKAVYKCTIKFKGRSLVLIKPTTYMNLSGKAVNYWLQQERIPIENLIVVSDDIALPYGKLRLKGKGSDGGHNGLKDIIATLNTSKFSRLRVGVGNNFFAGRQSDYVLGEWSTEETETLAEKCQDSCSIIKDFCTIGLGLTMTNWNGK